jgi:hypothetical protein
LAHSLERITAPPPAAESAVISFRRPTFFRRAADLSAAALSLVFGTESSLGSFLGSFTALSLKAADPITPIDSQKGSFREDARADRSCHSSPTCPPLSGLVIRRRRRLEDGTPGGSTLCCRQGTGKVIWRSEPP